MSNETLAGLVALVTGAGRAPATAIGLRFAELGATVAANDLSPNLLDPLAASAAGSSGRFQAYIADATRGMPLRAMLDEILEDCGKIDVLVNNPRIQPNTPLIEMDEWDWQRTVEMNLNGPFLVTRLVAKLMREQGGGVILNIVDTNPAALDAPGCAAYAASQQGLLALSQAAARELMAYNIRVFTLCPDEQALNQQTSLGDPSGNSLARLATYICSPAAARLPGQVFQVNSAQETPLPAIDGGQQE